MNKTFKDILLLLTLIGSICLIIYFVRPLTFFPAPEKIESQEILNFKQEEIQKMISEAPPESLIESKLQRDILRADFIKNNEPEPIMFTFESKILDDEKLTIKDLPSIKDTTELTDISRIIIRASTQSNFNTSAENIRKATVLSDKKEIADFLDMKYVKNFHLCGYQYEFLLIQDSKNSEHFPVNITCDFFSQSFLDTLELSALENNRYTYTVTINANTPQATVESLFKKNNTDYLFLEDLAEASYIKLRMNYSDYSHNKNKNKDENLGWKKGGEEANKMLDDYITEFKKHFYPIDELNKSAHSSARRGGSYNGGVTFKFNRDFHPEELTKYIKENHSYFSGEFILPKTYTVEIFDPSADLLEVSNRLKTDYPFIMEVENFTTGDVERAERIKRIEEEAAAQIEDGERS